MDYAAARHNMVESQIRTNRITDSRLIGALATVPREIFVPKQLRGIAYLDSDIELGGDSCLMAPLAFAGLVQALEIGPDDVVLDVGCGTGYSAAILSRLAATVVALESDGEMERRATALLAEQGVDNVAVVTGPLAAGDASHGPYQVILLEGMVGEIPNALLDQLAEGGRLGAIVGDTTLGHAVVVTRVGNDCSTRVVFDATACPLPGFQRQVGFVF